MAVTCLPVWMPFAKVSLAQEDERSRPGSGYGSAQEPEVGIGSENCTGRRKSLDW